MTGFTLFNCPDPIFQAFPGKNEPHIGVPAVFMGPDGITDGKKQVGPNDITVSDGCISAVIWQTGAYIALVSTRTEKTVLRDFFHDR